MAVVCAAIVSKDGILQYPGFLPIEYRNDISQHAHGFLDALGVEDDEIELPYIETTIVRYIYKQTDDLYWLLVTRTESDMFTDINLLGKFVCTIMEYGDSETNSITLTNEQRDLFYRHIWRPWDDSYRCTFCGCQCHALDHLELESRLEFLISIRDGHVKDDDVNYFNGLIAESWQIALKLTVKKSATGDHSSFSSVSGSTSEDGLDESIGEETLIDNVRLKCLAEDMRIALSRIQDPYLRLFARKDLLVGTNHEQNHVSSAPTLKELNMEYLSDSE